MNPIEIIKSLQKDAKNKASEVNKKYRVSVFCGNATCENAAGAQLVKAELAKLIREKNLTDVYIGQTGCSGRCDKEPIVQVIMEGKIPTKYCEMTPEKIGKVFEQHILGNNIVKEWTL